VFPRTETWTPTGRLRLPVPLDLKAGKNTLRITCLDGVSLVLGKIHLTAPGRQEIVIDARRFAAQGGGQVQVVASNENGFFTQWDDRGHALEWTVEVPSEGDYRMAVVYAATYKPVREVRVNGAVVPGMEQVAFNPSGGWRYWIEEEVPGSLPLKAGPNTIRMTNVEGGMNLSAIIVRGGRSGDIVIPAISFTAESGGRVVTYGMPKHGAVYNWDTPGHWLEWTVQAPVAGKYEMTIRYATRENAVRDVQVNGEPAGRLAVTRGAGWDDWKTAVFGDPVTLRKGKNTVQMTNVNGGLNLDELVFTLHESK